MESHGQRAKKGRGGDREKEREKVREGEERVPKLSFYKEPALAMTALIHS